MRGELLDAPKAPGSCFSIELVLLILKMVFQGAISMRAASRISGLICEAFGGHRLDGPTHSTVQNYVLRVGLDQIENRNDDSSDRVWITDHMIAAGSLKCLVVLGISIEKAAQLNRPLEHQDVNVLTLIPTEESTGAIVNEQLEQLAQRRGVPVAILSDCGSDLKKGVELFQQAHPETISLHDIVHLASRLIWKRLSKEDRFSEYRQGCCQCANKLRQSPLAHLKPPRPKTKARYMNLGPEIRWGRRALWLLDRVRSGDLSDRQRSRLNLQEVEQQLGWLEQYREDIRAWTSLCEVTQTSCQVVRRFGYSSETVAQLRDALGTSTDPVTQGLIEEITEVVEEQCRRCEGQSTRLPGSSEVIESLIGKGKRLMGTSQNNNSLTGQILSLAASTATITSQTLLESLSRCSISAVRDWVGEKIKQGVHVTRRLDLTEPPPGNQVAQSKVAAIANF